MITENNQSDMILKDLYREHFKMGASCERIHDQFTNNEIGNPEKEALILKHFDSITFANELKPAYNMGFSCKEATEEFLPFVINPLAKDMLDWVKKNGMKMRGHVMVWHSQCPKEIFCKGYKPVTIPTDPELLKEKPFLKHFEKLNPVCYVDRDTLLKRMHSYIYNLLYYIYDNDYADIIYAWDVVNEAIELEDKTPTGLRNSYWYQIIGDDFVYWAFKYAHDAVEEISQKFEGKYGRIIKPALFYNDYNEMDPAKKEAIIALVKREGHGHKSILEEGLIDGFGMQGHISDNNDVKQIIDALKEYSSYVNEVHITELDVKCTCTNVNAEYYQAVFYKKLFEELIKANSEGAKLTSVTLWGLTDDNSWIKGANPLLFRKDLSYKKSFDALVYACIGGDLGEPEPISYDISDRNVTFEFADKEPVKPEELGFKMIGFGEIEIQDRVVRSGRYALANEKRFGGWSFIGYDISDFIGQTIEISAWVQSPALKVALKSDAQREDSICVVDTNKGEWSYISGRYKVPNDAHSMFLRFETIEAVPETFSPVYVDELSIHLDGLYESFEENINLAAIRGAGHLPYIYATDDESVDGKSKSLCVTRHEKDATVKFDITPYIGHDIDVEVYVKTKDAQIRVGLDAPKPVEWIAAPSNGNDWTKINLNASLASSMTTAHFYIETDGNADMYIDELVVKITK